MSASRGHDLNGLIKWSAQNEWQSRLDAVKAEHFERAMSEFGLTFPEIGDALGGNWGTTLWGCAFEDFLTRRYGPDGQNPVETYLRRQGWKERVATRAYMASLQSSVMSLYEVSDIVPGQSLRARDLVRGGDPVLVSEHSATRTLRTWDRIAGRIVLYNTQTVLAGGFLAFTLQGSQALFSRLRDQTSHASHGGQGRRNQAGALEGWRGSDEDLRHAAPLFTAEWLFDVLPGFLGTGQPPLFNSDGDRILFHIVNFPLLRAASARAVESRLNRLEELRQASPTFWNWLEEPSASGTVARHEEGLVLNSTMEDGRIVLGTIELRDCLVLLSVNSDARAERGRALLTTALAGLVSPPLTEIQTVEQMKAAPRQSQPADPIPAEIRTRIVHDLLDKHYRALLDKPVSMLSNKSPCDAAGSAYGRKELIVWLKHLENRSISAGENDPLATYDFTWLWRELDVEHLRK